MQLTLYTDYSLRVLLYLGVHPDELVTIGEIADAYRISRNHLVKVVHHLASMGFVHTTRGKGGGVRLMRPPEEIRLGEVIRSTEGGFDLVECMNGTTNTCPIDQLCALKGVVREALGAFTSVWDRYTLADVLRNRGQLKQVLVPLPRRPSAP
ncbi:MAG: Rrf2 family transcriptional regulator [Gammaproteobacteria bacterium]|jgi:Rrf2 family nitric oxide-sensitive transcriptional repressor|nr:Rrf2 family transcriptional regulator [Gammaproteobacteria bacterium]